MKLLTTSNAKTLKSKQAGYLTFILHLAPASLSGYNVCPGSSAGCRAACLNTAGRGKFDTVQAARIRKTRWFYEDRDAFMAALVADVVEGIAVAKRANLRPAFRLNGTSDIRWENISVVYGGNIFQNIMRAFPDIQFYDYTKLSNRMNLPANYHLTFSRSEENDAATQEALKRKMNVAVVFQNPPPQWNGLPVIDGDINDLRFTDGSQVIVGLKAKGRGKKDQSGFVL